MPRGQTTRDHEVIQTRVEESGSHAESGATGPRVSGLADRDAIELLEEQHRACESLLDQLQGEASQDQARATLHALADLLIGHALIEERHFYPAVRTADTERLVIEALQDHTDVKRLLLHILEAGEADEELREMLEELQGLVDSHVREEEDELFPRVRSLLAEEQLEGLAQEMIATLADEQARGEPRERLQEALRPALATS